MNTTKLFIPVIFFLNGCATQAITTTQRIDPHQPAFSYEKTINKPVNEVWDSLVKNMAKSFFVINNIDKESRIINISYSSEKPEDYVDCGRTKRTLAIGNKTEVYDNGITDSYALFRFTPEKQADARFAEVATIARTATLEGKANIYIAPENIGSIITVNSKSVVTLKSAGEIITTNGVDVAINRVAIQPFTNNLNSVTKGISENQINSEKGLLIIKCYSTGKFENEILNFVN